mmetsp:Transcript_14342/g.29228  ORF Transcript_14342/g.29228 Transcript_14342/m.29228 type:complete len:80 (-) Transcript_14342:55-294(-)
METKRTVIGGASFSGSVAVDDDDDDDDDEYVAMRTLCMFSSATAAELGRRAAVEGRGDNDGCCRIRRWIIGSRRELDSS